MTGASNDPGLSAVHRAWQCPWCGRETSRTASLHLVCASRSCECGALGLGAPAEDSDEIIDDAIGVFGIAEGFLTPYNADRLDGLRRVGTEVLEGRLPAADEPRYRALWFRRTREAEERTSRDVARILDLIRTCPNARTTPLAGDLEGQFDLWFDGGAVKHDTGISTYRFTDGSWATIGTTLVDNFTIHLADGRRARPPHNADPFGPLSERTLDVAPVKMEKPRASVIDAAREPADRGRGLRAPTPASLEGAWLCSWCGREAARRPSLSLRCASRLCECGALGLSAPPEAFDELIEDAIGVYGMAESLLTHLGIHRRKGLRRVGAESREGSVATSDQTNCRVLWFRRGPARAMAPFPYRASFSPEEFDTLRRELVPRSMDDKWSTRWDGDWLSFHRSWTGFCIYRIQFRERADRHEVAQALVCDDDDMYHRQPDDYEIAFVDWLIRYFLLNQDVVMPMPAPIADLEEPDPERFRPARAEVEKGWNSVESYAPVRGTHALPTVWRRLARWWRRRARRRTLQDYGSGK